MSCRRRSRMPAVAPAASSSSRVRRESERPDFWSPHGQSGASLNAHAGRWSPQFSSPCHSAPRGHAESSLNLAQAASELANTLTLTVALRLRRRRLPFCIKPSSLGLETRLVWVRREHCGLLTVAPPPLRPSGRCGLYSRARYCAGDVAGRTWRSRAGRTRTSLSEGPLNPCRPGGALAQGKSPSQAGLA